MKAKTNYITNRETMDEVWKSKLSYCSLFEPLPQRALDCDFDHDGTEFVPTGLCRVFTYDHIPDSVDNRGGHRLRKDKVALNFRPFKLFLDGREIARSHWQGGHNSGSFSLTGGRLTRRLALQIETMAKRIAMKPNFSGYSYIDEIVANAVVKCLEVALKFDDSRTENPFAYFTTIIINEFRRTLTIEKRIQTTRDAMLFQAGVCPSYSSEHYH